MRVIPAAIAAFLILAGSASAQSPDIVISQVYGGGGNFGATLRNDFIELYNRGTAPVPLAGWTVQYASSAGTFNQSTPLTGTIRPGRHYLVQEAAGTGGAEDLPTPNATGAIAMSATSGKVRVVTGDGTVRDLVGYGTAANQSETAPTPNLSNTTAAIRNGGGAVDTDNNLADFTIGAPNPRNSPPAVSITASDPANGENDVPLDGSVSITFSGPVTPTFGITCSSSGAHEFSTGGGPTAYTLDPVADFARGETCTVTVRTDDLDEEIEFSTLGIEGLRIHDIQGTAHLSPYAGRRASFVPGVVTAVRGNGFWMQDPEPDADPASSEGIFVFTGSRPAVAVGTAVSVSGLVTEFRPGGESSDNLTTTQLERVTVYPGGAGAEIDPTVVGEGGRVPPRRIIDNDAFALFQPRSDGIDFYESLEGMLLQVNDAAVVGPRNNFGEVWVVGDDGRNARPRTSRGGLRVTPRDFNPERIQLDDALAATPVVDVGDRIPGATVGVLSYDFGNFELLPLTAPVAVSGGLEREVTESPRGDELAVATFNVENLDPSDTATIPRLAALVVENLKSPDLIGIEEMQDNTGAANDGTTGASLSWQAFIDAIAAAGGPRYEYRQIDPENNADGGQPGGNIRVGFLFRTDRGLRFVDRPGGDATTPTGVVESGGQAHLTLSPGRVDPQNPAWEATRKPLAGEFTWRGETFFAIVNHFSSKGGDDPLFGRVQPPVRSSEVARHQQAASVNAFVRQILDVDRKAPIVVLGDINDFEFSETTEILEGGELTSLFDVLPKRERYSYVFEGNSQVLDQILLSKAALRDLEAFDVVHVNAEFADQASDHDPSVARLELDD